MGELLPEELELGTAFFCSEHRHMTYSNSLAAGIGYDREAAREAAAAAEAKLGLQGEAEAALLKPNDDAHSVISATELDTMERETWGKKVDFLLSVIGFAVDLANIWRFPYLCFKNGGGVFLIPYTAMLLLGGIPLFYMELALGQYYRQGAITTWGRVCPLFKGIGYCVVFIAFYVDFFYNVIISWALRFFINSMRMGKLPWSHCGNPWNSPMCYEPSTLESNPNLTLVDGCHPPVNETAGEIGPLSAANEYFYKEFLHITEPGSPSNSAIRSIFNLGRLQWESVLCLMAVYVICYFSLWKGISMSGKVVWFTAVFPYIVLVALFIRGVTLPGASRGIHYYLNPDLKRLWSGEVWFDAATQVFFSLGPGFGVLLAYASYNKFHNNVYQDALITSLINCGTSFLSGFVIFSVLGYMSCQSGRSIQTVASEGPGLVFVVYPEALSTMPYSTVWSLIFFLMLITLGLDSSFGGSEAIITALSDEWPILRRHREIFVGCLFSLYMVIGLLMCTEGGLIFVEFLSVYAASWGLLMAVMCEAIVISWIYGLDRFVGDIKEMMGFEPGRYWRFCWAVMGPLFMFYNLFYGLLSHMPYSVLDYQFPPWLNIAGFVLAFSSAACIPIVGVYQFAIAKGDTFMEKLRSSVRPWKESRSTYVAVAKDDNQSTHL